MGSTLIAWRALLAGVLLIGLSGAAVSSEIYYIHSDHLNTPRLITNQHNQPVWRNAPLNEPFGAAAVEEDPRNTGTRFEFNLRFPGQYYDKETNTHYNGHRDYNPTTGRYIQADPIGLEGGINLYGYVNGNPISLTDPLGLWPSSCTANPVNAALCAEGTLPGGAVGIGRAAAAAAPKPIPVPVPIPTPKEKEQCPPGDRDPCKGLRDQLRDHERKLRDYMANPMSMDNRGFLAGALVKNDQDLYNTIYTTRLISLQKQIANFKKQLEECERHNGR